MKSNFCKLLIVLTGLIALSGISSCAGSSDFTSVNPTNTETANVTITLPAVTPTPKPTLTKVPMPTEIPTRPPLPTMTAIATLPETDASTEILRLLSVPNNACAFPCWWNLIPGETRMADAQNYLSSLRIVSVGTPLLNDNKDGHIRFRLPQSQNSYLDIYLEFEGKNETLDWLRVSLQRQVKVTHATGETSYEISWGDPKLAEITKPYSLARVLTTYGAPAKVLVFTHQLTLLNQPWPISLVMFYPKQGFMIEYVADDRPVSKNPGVMWCPSLAFPYFWFWSPSEEITIEDMAKISGYQLTDEWIASGRFKTLEEATGMSLEEFYNLYTTNENACITTPNELWPLPGQ